MAGAGPMLFAVGMVLASLCGSEGRVWTVASSTDNNPNSTTPCADPSDCTFRGAFNAVQAGDSIAIKVDVVELQGKVSYNGSTSKTKTGTIYVYGATGSPGNPPKITQKGGHGGFIALMIYDLNVEEVGINAPYSNNITFDFANLEFTNMVSSTVLCLSAYDACGPFFRGQDVPLRQAPVGAPRVAGKEYDLLKMEGVKFTNCHSIVTNDVGRGGRLSIYNTGNLEILRLKNLEFRNNTMFFPNNTYYGRWHTTLVHAPNIALEMSDSLFVSNNMSRGLGAMVTVGQYSNLRGLTFVNNRLGSESGIISTPYAPLPGAFYDLNLTDSTLTDNAAPPHASTFGELPAIWGRKLHMKNVTFQASAVNNIIGSTAEGTIDGCNLYTVPGAKEILFVRYSEQLYNRTIYNRNPVNHRNLASTDGYFANCHHAKKGPLPCDAGETCHDLMFNGLVTGYRCGQGEGGEGA